LKLSFPNIKRVLSIFFLSGALSGSTAQLPFVQKIRFNLPYKEPGFTKMVQDSHGFIWLGSDHGLFQFDGLSFKEFRAKSDSMDLKVTALYSSPDGKLWIGCKNGRIYCLENNVIEGFQPEEGTSGTGISDIVEDTAGGLWWSTFGEGVYYYVNGRVYNIDHEDGLTEDYVYDLEPEADGTIWAGTDGGVTSLKQEDGKKIITVPVWNADLPDPIVRVVKKDGSERIWLGFYDRGPGYVDLVNGKFILPPFAGVWPYGPASDLQILRDEIWISTLNGNLIEINCGKVYQIIPKETLADKIPASGKIQDLLEDSEGNIFILSSSGLYRTTGNKLIFYDRIGQLDLSNIHALIYDTESGESIWISNDQGLFRADLAGGKVRQYLEAKEFKDLKVTCLAKDKYNFVWAGSFNYGLFRIDPVSGRFERITENQGLVNNNVLAISIHEDTLWTATLGGASELIISRGNVGGFSSIRSFNSDNGLVSNYIYSAFEDTHDRVWFATDGDGISVFDNGRFSTIATAERLGDDVIYSIRGDDKGNVWIATASAGVYCYDGESFRHFGIEEGLNSLQIAGLTTSGDEVLVIEDNGLDVIHIPTGRIIHYGEEVNLGDISPDLNVFCKDPEGNIWIGTKSGIVRYRPVIKQGSTGPATILEQMSVFLTPVDMQENLVLPSTKNNISFKYTGIWMSNPERVSFQVMLEGSDLEWKNTFDQTAVYSSLPPGHYTFRVRTSASQSFTNSNEASFSFRIRQPFYTTPWFFLLLIAGASLAVYYIIRRREQRLRNIEEQKKQKIEFEFQMLKNQINPHFLFNSFSTLISLIEDQPRQAVEYTEKLSDFFRIILQLKEEELIPLKQELVIVDHYNFLLRKRFGENLVINTEIQNDDDGSRIPPMTLQILVENAVKHNIISKDKPLNINILIGLKYIVVENKIQLKKTPEVSTGIGLQNISKRYRLKTDQDIRIENDGKMFRVILPLIFT
jgi:ligand-binding sensor domain-containing protein